MKIEVGLSPKQVAQLIAYTQNTQDKNLLSYTSDWENGQGRFASINNYQNWLKKGKTIYSLCDNRDSLAGIIWFSNKVLPSGYRYDQNINPSHYQTTFAIRLYGQYRGKGLSKEFMKECLTRYIASNKKVKGLWLETYKNNTSAVSSYKHTGWKLVGENATKIIMVYNI